MIGKKFNKLLVLEIATKHSKNCGGHTVVKCLCDCGNNFIAIASRLRHNRTKSCGCLIKKYYSEKSSYYKSKNNNIGYILTNILPCCKDCNFAKHTLEYEEFIKLVEQVYTNRIL